MSPQHPEAEKQNAIEVLKRLNAQPGQDFFTMSPAQVCDLLVEADRMKYRKPKNANGSRGRYFYAMLQRRAARNGAK